MLLSIQFRLSRLYILKYSHLCFTSTPVKYYVPTFMNWGEQICNVHEPASRIFSDKITSVCRLMGGICFLGTHILLWTVNLESTIMRCNGRIGCCKLCRESSLWASFSHLSLSEKSVPFHVCLCWVQLFTVHVIILYRIIKQRHLDQGLICLPKLSNALWLQQDTQSNNSNPCLERLRFYVYTDILNYL